MPYQPSVPDRSRRRATLAVLGATLLASGCRIESVGNGGEPAPEEPGLDILVAVMLETQAIAWNDGDLDGFMAAYARSPETTYIGASGLIVGIDGIRARYAPLFEPGAARDSLRFADLVTRELDPRLGIATARYILERDGAVTSTGPFTLVLMRVEGDWRIVHDQSAADPTL